MALLPTEQPQMTETELRNRLLNVSIGRNIRNDNGTQNGDEPNLGQQNGNESVEIGQNLEHGGDAQMEFGQQMRGGLGWTSICCPGSESHEFCENLKLEDLDPVLGNTEIGSSIVKTPMQGLLSVFVLRSGTVQSMAAARTFVEMIFESGPKMELCTFFGKRSDFVATGKFPSDEDQFKAIEKWIANCYVAREMLTKTAYGPLTMQPPEGFDQLREEDQEAWRDIFDQSPWILELVRAETVHKAAQIVLHPRVFVGDSSSCLLQPFFDQFSAGDLPIR